jgi:Phage integrase, N-terminal SAM-like domain/Putative transposase
MPTLRRRRLEDRPLRGLAPKTPPCDVAAVRHLAPHHRRPPDQRSEAALRQYVLSRLNDKKVAERTGRIHLYGIRFFSARTLQRPWPRCAGTRPRPRQQLPVGWSPHEVRALLAAVARPIAQMCRRMISAGGLRLREGRALQVADIPPKRGGSWSADPSKPCTTSCAAAPSLLTLAAAPHAVGGLIGGLCGLHTWTQALVSQPHVHGLVPAGGLATARTEWRPARRRTSCRSLPPRRAVAAGVSRWCVRNAPR